MEKITSESFKTIVQLMRILGWYPPTKNSRIHLIRKYVMYVFFLILICGLITAKVIIERSYNEMQMIYITETFSYSFKLLPFLTHGQRIKKCVEYFDKPYFAPTDEVEKKIISESVTLCKRIFAIYMSGVLSAILLSVCPPFFAKSYQLPTQIWLPYDETSSALVYYPTLLYYSTATTYLTCATSLLDPLIGGLAYHGTSQLKILKHRLQNPYKVDKNKQGSSNFGKKIVCQNLARCIQQHNAILEYIQFYEKCFSWPVFSQFCGTTLCLCFCCIALTTVPLASVASVMYVFLFMVAIGQVGFYCYFGTLLYEENNTLVTDIYMSDWYEYDVNAKKLLITLMERSKRPVIVKAEKLIDLTLETFSMMIRRSYSLVAVLK